MYHGMYKCLCTHDPAMRKYPQNRDVATWVPDLKWLQMISHRERTLRNILASLARAGFRTPEVYAVDGQEGTAAYGHRYDGTVYQPLS